MQSSLWDRLRRAPQEGGRGVRNAENLHALVGADGDSPLLRRRQQQQLQQIGREIERELLWLLSTRERFPEVERGDWSEVRASVLNYGLPDFSGKTASGLDLQAVSKVIREKVAVFEPRLHAETLVVTCHPSNQADAFVVEIGGQYGPVDRLQTLSLEATISLTSGQIAVALAKAA